MNAQISRKRADALIALTQDPLDILVIGGGIVGSGVARDAAMRGLKTGLVEQHDFAFGTSSRSSRLLHGGLRYLAQGRVGLVREASVEKKILHQIAPHLAGPLAFLFPTYKGTDWPLWQLRIGVKIYDLLCSGRNLGSSSSLSAAMVSQALPGIVSERLTGAVRYFDGLTNDARLVLDTLRSAANNGATPLNYCKFKNASFKDGIWNCDMVDEVSGKEFRVQSRAVVNATGPWAQGLPHSQVKLRLTKGIHLVVPRVLLPVPDAVVLTEGKRILFLIPWGACLIIGTTDTDYSGSLDDVRANGEDIAYVLKVVQQFFPKLVLREKSIISSWAGLRPLIANPNGTASDISRSHEIHNPEPHWWDVAGGKLTTYRLMAEQTVDQIVAKLKLPASPCRTAKTALLPENETKGISALVPPEFCEAVIRHYCENEWARHLDDVMLRRTSWHYYHADAAEKAEVTARWMAGILGWTDDEKNSELNRYHARTKLGAS